MPADDLDIRPVTADDDTALAAWFAVHDAAHRGEVGPYGGTWTLPEVRASLLHPGRRHRHRHFAGYRGGEVVVSGFLSVPLLDNLDRADVRIEVPATLRRQGLGSAMLAFLEAEASRDGRQRLEAAFGWPLHLGPDGAGAPGVEFARARGFRLALVDLARELRLPVPADVLDRLAAQAAECHAGYTLHTWEGAVPDDLVRAWAELDASLSTEAPTGDLDPEPTVVDVEAHRAGEALAAAQGRTSLHCVARDPDGAMVAYSELSAGVHDPGRVYQWGTLVHRDARGHRLGLAVKTANLRQLQALRSDVTTVLTWNAESNTHMIAVNEALGFRPVARYGSFARARA